MAKLNWLHLTDFHFGQKGQSPLWPNVQQGFFDDLERVHRHTGPWDLVLFSGDLVQAGSAADFAEVEERVFSALWNKMEQLGSNPKLLAVPGNHDLARPTNPSAALRLLLLPGSFQGISDEFYDNPDSEYRQVIASSFANYSNWWRTTKYRPQDVRDGLLPGEFSVTLTAGGLRVGIVGLNSTFLQLADGDFRGRLAWDVRQLNAACTGALGGDAPKWIADHDVCLLMTHQGPEWLDRPSFENYSEIYPAGRFALHLFGHMHENVVRGISLYGGKTLWQWQGESLFGLEHFGNPPVHDRRHGFAAGTIEAGPDGTATLRHWPRKAIRDNVNGWRFDRDTEHEILEDHDGGTAAAQVWTKQPAAAPLRTLAPSALLPPAIQGALKELNQSSFLYHREMSYLIELVEDDGRYVWVKIEYAEELFNASDVAIDLSSSFTSYSRDRRNLEASIDDRRYEIDTRPEALSGDGVRIGTQIPSGTAQRVRCSAEVKYGRADSELFLSYRLCERFRLSFHDLISERSGEKVFDVIAQPLHLKKGVVGQPRTDPTRINAFDIAINSGLLPYNGVRLQWKRRSAKSRILPLPI